MKSSSTQLHRLIRLVSELKQNKYPNCNSFAKKLKDLDINDNLKLSCSPKTIQRDIKLLTEEYGAPIGYDSNQKGYYLRNHGWDFAVPLFDENFLLSSLLGARTAESIIPDPLKSEIRDAVDMVLTTNNPDFLDTALIETFIIASGIKVRIVPQIFKTLFSGWQLRNSVKIKYLSHSGDETERLIDPHILTYCNSAWYIKAYCHLKNEFRIFALHRIEEAELTEYTFESDRELISEANNKQSFFCFEEVKDIEVWCSGKIAGYVIEQSEASENKITQNNDDSILLHIASTPEAELIKWILSEGGEAKIIRPKWLWEKVKEKAKKIIDIKI